MGFFIQSKPFKCRSTKLSISNVVTKFLRLFQFTTNSQLGFKFIIEFFGKCQNLPKNLVSFNKMVEYVIYIIIISKYFEI